MEQAEGQRRERELGATMSLGEPYVRVTCDGCGEEGYAQLSATARGDYSERHLRSEIESWGWTWVDEDTQYCDICQEELQSKNPVAGIATST